ncbi:Ada metal-binding domain-containing protein [Pseudorhodobacter ferrugineus]
MLFFETVGACIEAGFRACKRCHPMAPMAEVDPAIKTLTSYGGGLWRKQ